MTYHMTHSPSIIQEILHYNVTIYCVLMYVLYYTFNFKILPPKYEPTTRLYHHDITIDTTLSDLTLLC